MAKRSVPDTPLPSAASLRIAALAVVAFAAFAVTAERPRCEIEDEEAATVDDLAVVLVPSSSVWSAAERGHARCARHTATSAASPYTDALAVLAIDAFAATAVLPRCEINDEEEAAL